VKPKLPNLPNFHCETVRLNVAGWAACRFHIDQLPNLRQQPGPVQGSPLSASFLKHTDEQTVAGLAAVLQAIDEHQLKDIDFSRWGVVAAPRFLGRTALALALARFTAEGAWGVSPHLIPHRSLHSISGTISQALKIHGPNYGVGGGSDGAAEALLAGSALLEDSELPGLWVVLTGFDPELVPADPGETRSVQTNTDCLAVALALVPAKPQETGTVLTVAGANSGPQDNRSLPSFSLESFFKTLSSGAQSGQWRLGYGGRAAWEHVKAAVEMCL
jgi:hypothetical protein